MARKIQHKRGLESNLPTLAEAEWGLTTDTEKPFIGGPNGNIEIAKKKDVDEALADKANASTVQGLSQTVNTKADAEYVETELAKKADTTALETKADVTALETKADKEEVTTLSAQLADKASQEDITAAVEPKADKTYVDAELSKKADAETVNALSAETVKQVNGQTPDETGNVTIDVPEVDTSNLATKTELANVLDGSPKGVYATLTDLQTTFPTGAEGVYIVQADGHIYSWDGAAWADRGLYQAQGIADGSVTVEKLDKGTETSVFTNNILDFDISGRSVKVNRTDDLITSVEEKHGTIMVRLTNLYYDADGVKTIEQIAGGKKVTSTVNRINGEVNSITKVVTDVV